MRLIGVSVTCSSAEVHPQNKQIEYEQDISKAKSQKKNVFSIFLTARKQGTQFTKDRRIIEIGLDVNFCKDHRDKIARSTGSSRCRGSNQQ